jgi:lipopolysaccharide export LptBFGC system permease protein LptF
MKTENQSSGYSNANDNESLKAKNETFNDDVNMAAGASQMGEDLREESYISRSDSMAKSCSKADGDAYTNSASRKAERRKLRTNKRVSAKNVNNRKRLKRTHEESSHSDYKNERDSLEEIMHYRSIKIIKEREEIVEGRNLGQKVSAFCGVTPTMLADRANETVKLIREAIERD